MSLWKYCEKVEMCVGLKRILDNIHKIQDLYQKNYTVGQCVDMISDGQQ